MDELQPLLTHMLGQKKLIQATLSQRRNKETTTAQKVVIKPVELKGQLYYQFSLYIGQQVKHRNERPEQSVGYILELLQQQFRQALFQTTEQDYQVLISKKGKIKILKKKPSKQKVEVTHNRQKKYILEEGKPVPFFIDLGVMTTDGKVKKQKYDKFKQINRFLEMVKDAVPHLSKDRTIHIVDFGCGKSYLTFALYYYLTELEGFKISVTGLDLKEDVIQHCQALTEKYAYEHLTFHVGDIGQYQLEQEVDMVVTLHACDTATDAALEKAVRWNAKVILSVPCCQHELFPQIQNESLTPLLQHGLLKERFSSLVTDAVRAQILTMLGYKTQILEFIDTEHTPKNLLIRAIKTGTVSFAKAFEEYELMKQSLHIDPYLERALSDKLNVLKREIISQKPEHEK